VTKPRTGKPPIIAPDGYGAREERRVEQLAAIRREMILWLPPEHRTEERIGEEVLRRLALVDPDYFLEIRRAARSFRGKEERACRAIIEEIHGELWEKPPFTSDRVIIPTLDAKYDETGGKPAKGSVLRMFDRIKSETARRQLDALTKRLTIELEGGHWHGYKKDDDDGPVIEFDALEKTANEALGAAFRPWKPDFDAAYAVTSQLEAARLQAWGLPVPAEPPYVTEIREWERREGQAIYQEVKDRRLREVDTVIKEILPLMIDERYQKDKTRGMRLHRPQEWAAMALLRLMGHPAPVPWPDAMGLIKNLTRDVRQDEGEAPL
jgi:hypothetical protein